MKVFAEARRLIGSAQTEAEESQRLIADFLTTECELTATLAQVALNSFAAGHLDIAIRTAASAKKGRDTVLRFRAKLKDDGAREQIDANPQTLDPSDWKVSGDQMIGFRVVQGLHSRILRRSERLNQESGHCYL